MPEILPIEMRDVVRRFGRVTAVDHLTLEIPGGNVLGLIGPSGSGKTTVVRMLAGTLWPTSGEIRVLGERPGRFRPATRERIGYMPQQLVLYPDLTVRENLAFVGALFGMYLGRRHRRVNEVLDLLGLADTRDRLTRELSGGQQRRLALAAALVHEPDVLLIDEPTAGIDPLRRMDVWNELRRLAGTGRALLVTTQYVTEAESCDLVALLADGQLLALAEPDVLRRHVYGGEILDVRTTRRIDPGVIESVPGIAQVTREGDRRLIVIAEDAAAATPRIVEAVQREAAVASIDRYEPSMEELFTVLVQKHEKEKAA